MTTASFVVPVRNEEKYILACLQSLAAQDYLASGFEILVVDGRSSDRTREIVIDISRRFPNVRCLDNPGGIVPKAMNIGIRAAKGDVIIRADGHTVYPDDYIENCVKYLDQSGADNVGGPLLTVPADNTLGARLVAAMLSNPFGVGDSRFRVSSKEGFVETVPFGAFRREVFDRVGMYNEKLVRNQDNELNARIRRAGGKIYQTPALQTTYHPVAGFLQLLKQTYRNSQWHVFSVRENVKSMGLRHFAPAVFVVMCAVLIGGSPVSLVSAILLASLLAGYLLAGWYFAFSKSKSYGLGLRLLLPFACFCFHVSYGLGTLAGCRYLLMPPSGKPIRAGQEVSQDQTA